MRYVFIVLAFCFALPLMGQKNSQLPFNQKSYPQFYSGDALVTESKNQDHIKPILEGNNHQGKSTTKTKMWNMPILKPESNSSTPVFPVDSSQTYFLQVYPYAKG